MKHFDIAVIGAGPAGANFARLADSEKYNILVIHNEGYETPCGGLLSPDAARVLAAYDLTLPTEILASPILRGGIMRSGITAIKNRRNQSKKSKI